MNHPKPEEWVPYLYGESPSSERQRLKQHLGACPECRAGLQQWKRNLKRLDSWKVSPFVRARLGLLPVLKWATATALVLVIGFSVGRSMPSQANLNRMRAVIEQEIRKQLRQEVALLLRQELQRSASTTLAAARTEANNLVEEAKATLTAQRMDDNQAIYTTLDRYFLTLKKDVDTVAVNTQRELVQLADLSEYSSAPEATHTP